MTRTWWAVGWFVAVATSGCGSDESSPGQPSGDGGTADSNTGGTAGQAGSAGQAGQSGSGGQAGSGGQGGAIGCPAELPPAVVIDPDGIASRLKVQGDPAGSEIGTFDPSIVRGADGTIAMSYTSVNLSRNKLHTRIALSVDGGATFTFATKANTAEENVTVEASGDLDCPGETCSNATIVHEVSGLVEDAADPNPSARWKLFTHSYVILQPDPQDPNAPRLRYQYGQLRMGSAPAAEGPWSAPQPVLGWPSAAPMSSNAPQLVTDLDGVQDCVALTEPSAMVDEVSGALELAVGCVSPVQQDYGIRIELLRSTDHGATWSHAHKLLDSSDGPCVGGGGPELNAAHLFAHGGQRYLIASPSGTVSFPGGVSGQGYRGCLVFRRTDDGVERDAEGAPVVVARIDPGEGLFAGACSDHPAGGYVLSALSFASLPDMFRMFGPIGTSP
jgi:hypothetical protein